MKFLKDELDRAFGARVSAAFSGVVLIQAARKIVGGPGVDRPITASNAIGVPQD